MVIAVITKKPTNVMAMVAANQSKIRLKRDFIEPLPRRVSKTDNPRRGSS